MVCTCFKTYFKTRVGNDCVLHGGKHGVARLKKSYLPHLEWVYVDCNYLSIAPQSLYNRGCIRVAQFIFLIFSISMWSQYSRKLLFFEFVICRNTDQFPVRSFGPDSVMDTHETSLQALIAAEGEQ